MTKNIQQIALIGGVAFVVFYLYNQYKAALALKQKDNGLVQNKPTMYEPSWSDPNSPKWGIGYDGKPAKIYSA